MHSIFIGRASVIRPIQKYVHRFSSIKNMYSLFVTADEVNYNNCPINESFSQAFVIKNT